ncbi:nucleotide sugar dehydrogenase [Sphingobacterium sp. NPDC055431]
MNKIAVIGLGYVGLPLAIEFAKYFSVVGYDIDLERIDKLKKGTDTTKEVALNDLKNVQLKLNPFSINRIEIVSDLSYDKSDINSKSLNSNNGNGEEIETNPIGLYFSSDSIDIIEANVFIITVPTPINKYNSPNLSPLQDATRAVASILKVGDLVIFESTVYPGCTEEECVPILENNSGLIFNKDFFVGYSPERIVPGDKINTLTTIKKVTSGSTESIAEKVDQLYKKIIKAGTFKAASIRVAEAAKAIENAQRDINISFVNELALIFDRMGIDTNDVLDAAETKFNFLKFKPGLVGGHCISVDPFYLAHKSSQLGYHPNVILSGRRVNDQMGSFIASKVVKLMTQKNIPIKKAKALILGLTFKENCSDVRNTKVIDIYNELIEYGLDVDVFDPIADKEDVRKKYNIPDINDNFKIIENNYLINSKGVEYDVIILAVAHKEFKGIKLKFTLKDLHVLFDVKGILPREIIDGRL